MKTINLAISEVWFLIGLLLYSTGQFLIFVLFNDLDTLHSQRPIDFAHWFMLIGVLCLVPQVTNFPRSRFNYLGAPILVLGIGLIVGMCVLDFVFWGVKSIELKRELVAQLRNTPSIWLPFMDFSGRIFNLGLLVSSLSYYQKSRIGTAIVLLGTLIIYVGGGWLNVVGYLVLTAGFYLSFLAAGAKAPVSASTSADFGRLQRSTK